MGNNDLEKLLRKLNDGTNGDYSYAKADEFDNPEVAKSYNKLIDSFMHKDNLYLARINDAMTRIADSSNVKMMLDEIDSQREPVKIIQQTIEYYKQNKNERGNAFSAVYALSKQIKVSFDEAGSLCDELIIKMNNLLMKNKLDVGTSEELQELIAEIMYMQDGMASANLRMGDLVKNITSMYHVNIAQGREYDIAFDAVASIAESFSRLFVYCLNVGGHLHRISRDIDGARNDMYKYNSWPLLHDRLKVFTVDHLTLAWRLYNHAVEYESLRINQINNPDGCKFGKWAQAEIQKDTEISHSEEFKLAVQRHYEFHDYAVSCFLLKESFKNREALSEFQETLAANGRFAEAIDGLHKYLNSQGIVDETEVWQFKGNENLRVKL